MGPHNIQFRSKHMDAFNEAPGGRLEGARDNSQRRVPATRQDNPKHFPIFPLLTERGDASRAYAVIGGSADDVFGRKSFASLGKYTTHQTRLRNIVNGNGNAHFIQRLKPADAKSASSRLALEIVPSPVPLYERNLDGTYKRDEDGNPIAVDGDTTANGHVLRWVMLEAEDGIGQGKVKAGDLAPLSGSATSQVYPIVDLGYDFGEFGNNQGMRIYAPTLRSAEPALEAVSISAGAFLYRIEMMERSSATSIGVNVPNAHSARYVDFAFKQGAHAEITDQHLDLTVALESYSQDAAPGGLPRFAPFSSSHVYYNNIELVSKAIADAENAHDPLAGLEPSEVNIVSGVDIAGANYDTLLVQGVTGGGISLNRNSTHYARGGSDGTIDEKVYDDLVREFYENWDRHEAGFMNDAEYPITAVWDSGFSLKTKESLAIPMSKCPWIFNLTCTQDLMLPVNSATQDSTAAAALRAFLANYPESQIHGTPACRAMVVARTGQLATGNYRGPVPAIFDLADKVSNYMGAGDGRWKTSGRFQVAPDNRVNVVTGLNAVYLDERVYNSDWMNGMTFPMPYQRGTAFWPAYPTVYPAKNSVLSDMQVAMAIAQVELECRRSWREMTNSKLTEAKFIEKSNRVLNSKLNGFFDDQFIFEVDTFFTDADRAAGNSYRAHVTVRSNTARTIGTFTVIADRVEG